jgi:Mn-dependent DtxR family transcriptional regulator
MEPNAQVPIYHHEAEQNKVVMDGATDEIVDGNKQQGYKLTALGYKKAIEIIKTQLLV